MMRICRPAAGLAAALLLTAQSPAMAADDCTEADKAAMATWFPHDQVKPPSDTLTSSSLCAFHVWSTQMFLWLTATDASTGQPNVLSLYTLDDLFAPIGADRAAAQTLRLRPRVAKSDTTDLDEINQAGSAGILVDPDKRAVYYVQYVNQTYYDFVRGKFFSQGSGGTFDPTLMAGATGVDDFFPAGAMELKLSWKITDGAADGFFTVPAEINKLTTQDGKVVIDPDATEKVTVALVGMHIAGVVDDHPEFIWATFEHSANAPNLPAGMDPSSDQPVSAQSFTFYAAGTPANASNVNPVASLALDEATQTLTPTVNVFREFAYGTIAGGPDADTNIASIQAVNSFYKDNFEPAGSVWQSYEEIGAIWMLPNTLEPGQFPITQLRGSTMLSNATMETYTQDDQQCFSCHNTLPVPAVTTASGTTPALPATNFNLSHILVGEFFRASATAAGMTVRTLR